MLSFFDAIRDVSLFSVIMRMFFAFSCGAAIGMERSYKNRPAGFRTHILVCIGAAIASTTGIPDSASSAAERSSSPAKRRSRV